MTQSVVTEKHNTVVTSVNTPAIITREPGGRVVVTGIMGPQGQAGANTLSALTDTNLTTLVNGSVLVYSSATQKWTSTTTLEDQYMNGGAF